MMAAPMRRETSTQLAAAPLWGGSNSMPAIPAAWLPPHRIAQVPASAKIAMAQHAPLVVSALPSTAGSAGASGVAGDGSTLAGEIQPREYRVYVESILRPLRPEALMNAARARGGSGVGNREGCTVSGRVLLEEALTRFVMQLRGFVTGCDDRKLSKAALRRARGIESQLGAMSERILVSLLQASVLAPEDLHGIWHGFSVVRGWRDTRIPQECLLQMLRGAMAELDDDEVDEWTTEALSWELTLPEVHQAISVSAWPPLCELLGRLPDCVTPADLQEALWQQSFVENPTHAPDHRNYRRFAMLAAQMVAIGVELESDKVEMLVHQTLELDRPWRERRDMLSGILSAASVDDRNRVVQHLDRRFEEHADIDDFEIVCGIAEMVGIEIPRDGAIRRCALRRWALDAKRGGALPVARLMDFVDCDATIGEDVANNLRSKGRIADAALLLARLPQDQGLGGGDCRGMLDVSNGDAELARLREILAMEDNSLEGLGSFQPMEEGAFRLPLTFPDDVGFAETAEAAAKAAARLKGSKLLSICLWKEDAPFWYAPVTLLALCSEERIELIDLVSVRNDASGGAGAWPDAANKLRALFSDPGTLKIFYGDDLPQLFAYTFGLGVANTFKRGDREPLGPALDLRAIIAATMGWCGEIENFEAWPRIARRYLGLRLCAEEAGSNWSRRPLRATQLHHAAVEAWSQLPVLRAVCAYGMIPRKLAEKHLTVQEKVKIHGVRLKLGKGHTLGQIAPVGRLADPFLVGAGELVLGVSKPGMPVKPFVHPGATTDNTADLPAPTRIASLAEGVPSFVSEDGQHFPELPAGSLVEVFEERFGALATVAPVIGAAERRPVPTVLLRSVNGWKLSPDWVSALPRPNAALLSALEAEGQEAEGVDEAPSAGQNGEEKKEEKKEMSAAASRRARRLAARRAGEKPLPVSQERAALAEKLIDELYCTGPAERVLQKLYQAQQSTL